MNQKANIRAMPRSLLWQVPGAVWDDKGIPHIDYRGKELNPDQYAHALSEELRKMKFSDGVVVLPEYAPATFGMDGLAELEKVAKEYNLRILAAHAEPTGKGILARESLLNSQTHQDKMYPMQSERDVGVIPSEDFELMEAYGRRFAVLICQDAPALFDPDVGKHVPGETYYGDTPKGEETKRRISESDAILVVSSSIKDDANPDKFDKLWEDLIMKINKETGKPVAYVNAANYGGHSRVVDGGKVVAELPINSEGIIFVN